MSGSGVRKGVIVACALGAVMLGGIASAQRSIVDAAGRAVRVPQSVERVLPAGPPASVLLLAVAPRALIGWTRAPTPAEAVYLTPEAAALPAYGRLTGRGNTANAEVVLRAKPDLILDVGSTSATFVTLAQRIEEQTGVPYVLLDGTLADSPRLLREVGMALGAGASAEPLAVHAADILRETSERIARIPPSRRVRVYYARGPNGLNTAPSGSLQAETLALAGGVNVIPAPAGFTGNLLNVSLEDVLAAQPEVIVAMDQVLAASLSTLPGWRDLRAVKAGRVYVPPDLPFGWFDAPPSVNRLLGVQWLARLLYPDEFPEPLAPRVKTFHRLFYHREPTDAEVSALLAPPRTGR